jgi:hypothetical protein
MIVDRLATAELEHAVERSARFRWGSGELRVHVRTPPELAAHDSDSSGWLAIALPLAMVLGEDLELDGVVSPRLMAATPRLQDIYTSWAPGFSRAAIEADTGLPDQPAPERVRGCFFSRGVDSMQSAASERPGLLVFCDGALPKLTADVRAEEIRLAHAAAGAMELPLTVIESNIRWLTDPLVRNWEDVVGAGLSCLALSLSGGIDRMLLASGDTWTGLEPGGSNPLLDPLFSTELTEIEHGDMALDRSGKVAWLARHDPELVPYLKVCFAENRPDNCGRCGKCLVTMAGLLAAGVLDQADGFPDRIDTAVIEKKGIVGMEPRIAWTGALRRLPLDGEGGRVRRSILRAFERSAWQERKAGFREPGGHIRAQRYRMLRAHFMEGRPWPPLADADEPFGPVGLVRCLDRRRRRHLYGAGQVPGGELVGEIGSLRTESDPDAVPAWLVADGRLVTPGHRPPGARPGPRRLLRWALAPFGWRGIRGRARLAAGRLLSTPRLGRDAAPEGAGEPAGYLHASEGPWRLPLFSATHPVTGDQLLSTSPWEANDMGYTAVELLGYVDDQAPVTGLLGTRRPLIPWASRLGQFERGG